MKPTATYYHSPKVVLTNEEIRSINALQRVASKWPDALWLFCGGQQGIVILKKDDTGHQVVNKYGSFDQDYAVACIHGIHADGGDW